MNSPLNSKSQGYGKSRWGNSRLSSRSPSMASRSPSNNPRTLDNGQRSAQTQFHYGDQHFRPRWGRKGSGKSSLRCRKCFGPHLTEECDIASSVSSSPLPQRSHTPQRISMTRPVTPAGIPGNSKAYSRPCKYFAVGKCMKGPNCTFLHDFVPPRQNTGVEIKAASGPHTRNRRSPAHFNMSRPPRRHPAPLNLKEEDLESTYFNRSTNLRPISPANVARSRPSSRSNQARMGNGGGNTIGFHFASEKQDRIDTILKGVLHRDEFQQEDRVGKNAGEEPKPPTPHERTFDFNVKTDQLLKDTCQPAQNVLQPQPPLTPSKAFTRPCKYYAQGFCVKGAACTFLHSTQDSIAISDRLNQSSGKDSTGNPVFVRLCRYYIKGQCAKGADCTFIHPTPEQLDAIKLKQTVSPPGSPISSPKIQERNPHPGLARPHSVPTRQQNRLTLPRPNSLPYHTQSQSPRLCINQNVSPQRLSMGEGFGANGENGSLLCTNINQNKAKTKPCKFYAIGQCLKGDQCTFIHGTSESRVSPPASLDLTVQSPGSPELSPSKRVGSPRFARHENRSYTYSELDDIEDYVAGCKDKDAQKSMVANSNVAAVVLTFDRRMREEINNTLTEIHNMIKELNKDSQDNDFIDFIECHSLGCTTVDPEQVADDVRRSDMDFLGRREALCQPRFGHILRWLKRKGVVGEDAAYLYQIEAVSPRYSYKYPYANISMVFQKGDKGERIEDVAIRGLFEKQHIILGRNYWDTAFKARAPPIYLQYFLNLEQLTKYPESRRVWFCGAHSLFVPILQDFELVRLEAGDEWPSGADVPSKYAALNVPVPTLYIKQKGRSPVLTKDILSINDNEEEVRSKESDEVLAMSLETGV